MQLIHEELLKSAELTGIWEKKLREIEKKHTMLANFLKTETNGFGNCNECISDNTNRRITIQDAVAAKTEEKAKKEPKKRERKVSTPPKEKKKNSEAGESKEAKTEVSPSPVATPVSSPNNTPDSLVGQPCPVCGKGIIIKGKTAYGCSEWKNGCTYRKTFE